MLARLRRWLRGPERYYWGPGIHLLPDIDAPPDELPPSAAIVPPQPTECGCDPQEVVEAIRRYERLNGRM